ncbi:MAG: YeeE/YedE family protein, partial [Spirochaetales bacterium]|nr:YeeE/YedE family protein [Spirochaetales bacterium]
MLFTVLSGIGIGTALGYTLQRGGFCMNTAFRSIVFEKDHSILRSWLLALSINLIAVNLLYEFRIINISIAPFFWPAAIIGGLVFGIGMVLAGGCTSGSCYRMGKGMLGSAGAFAGFAAGAMMTNNGIFEPIKAALRRPQIDVYGNPPDLVNIFPFDPLLTRWVVISIIVIAVVLFLVKAPVQ